MISLIPGKKNSSHRKNYIRSGNEEKIRRMSRSEGCLVVPSSTEVLLPDSNVVKSHTTGNLSEISSKTGRNERRKNAFILTVPIVYTELAKYLTLSRKRRRGSNQKGLLSNLEESRQLSKESKLNYLRCAVRENNCERVEKLCKLDNAIINMTNKRGISCLHEAAFDGHLNCIKILMENGASVALVDNEGFNCLDYAVLGGHYDCALYLTKFGAVTTNVRDGLVGIVRANENPSS